MNTICTRPGDDSAACFGPARRRPTKENTNWSASASPCLDVFRKGIANYSVFDTQIRLRGNVAVVMGSETVEPVGDAPYAGKPVNRRYRHVWRQEDGRWRLFARHAHIVSVD
jgi:ketosteroid isomerase-like protein